MSPRCGETFSNAQGKTDARLRVIFDNGTESNLLMRSLQRALHKDDAGRRITDPAAGPLFAGENAEGDQASGTIYVARSKSDHPTVAAHRDVLHKIGVTGGDAVRRIANAKLDPTFSNGRRRDSGDLRTVQHQPQQAGKPHPSNF